MYTPTVTPSQRQAYFNRQAMQQSERQAANALAASHRLLEQKQQENDALVETNRKLARKLMTLEDRIKSAENSSQFMDITRHYKGITVIEPEGSCGFLGIRHFIKKYVQDTPFTYEDIVSASRRRTLIRLRQNCIYDAWKHFRKKSLPQIGREFNRDHTTILYTLRKVAKERGEAYE